MKSVIAIASASEEGGDGFEPRGRHHDLLLIVSVSALIVLVNDASCVEKKVLQHFPVRDKRIIR